MARRQQGILLLGAESAAAAAGDEPTTLLAVGVGGERVDNATRAFFFSARGHMG